MANVAADDVSLLIQGASLFLVDATGENALHFAVRSAHLEIVQFLCRENRDLVKMENDRGMTPLMLVGRQLVAQCINLTIL